MRSLQFFELRGDEIEGFIPTPRSNIRYVLLVDEAGGQGDELQVSSYTFRTQPPSFTGKSYRGSKPTT